MVEALTKRFEDHMAQDEREFNDMKEIYKDVRDSIIRLETNHLAHIESYMLATRETMVETKTKVENLEWAYKIAIGAMITEVIALVFLLVKLKT